MMYETRYFWHCGKRVTCTDKQMHEAVYGFLARLGPQLQVEGYSPAEAARIATTVLHDRLFPDMESAFRNTIEGVRFRGAVDPFAIHEALELGLMTPHTTEEGDQPCS